MSCLLLLQQLPLKIAIPAPVLKLSGWISNELQGIFEKEAGTSTPTYCPSTPSLSWSIKGAHRNPQVKSQTLTQSPSVNLQDCWAFLLSSRGSKNDAIWVFLEMCALPVRQGLNWDLWGRRQHIQLGTSHYLASFHGDRRHVSHLPSPPPQA